MRQSAPGSQGGSTRPRKDIEPNDLIVELAEIAVEKPRRAALNPLHTQADRKPTGREVDREVQVAPRQLSPGSPNAPNAPASLWRLRRAAGLRVAYHIVPSAQRSTPRARRRAARRYAGPDARPVRPGSTSSSRDVRQSPPITRIHKRDARFDRDVSTSDRALVRTTGAGSGRHARNWAGARVRSGRGGRLDSWQSDRAPPPPPAAPSSPRRSSGTSPS